MGNMRFGALSIDPRTNPAILDTVTWDRESAWKTIREAGRAFWTDVKQTAHEGKSLPSSVGNGIGISPAQGSLCIWHGVRYLAAVLGDWQHVFVSIGNGETKSPLGKPLGVLQLNDGDSVCAYPADSEVIHRFCSHIMPEKGPRALGNTPRLGIGVRMTTSVWPAIWPAMKGFAANAIQNSVRELSLLEDVLAGRPAHTNHLFSFGAIEEGHTGSTFEGLWTAGVMEAIKSETTPVYGADADHIQVKRGPGGLDRAKRVIDAARRYSFYTLDVSDILDYSALSRRNLSTEYLETRLDSEDRKAVLDYHGTKQRFGTTEYNPTETEIGCLVGKHSHALQAIEELFAYVTRVKGTELFDLELSIDENPPEVQTCDSITRETELIFLILEVRRRQIRLTHIAPNFGVEKGVDYRCPDGLEGLERRVRSLHQIAEEQGLMLDCHSGDDLSRETRRVFGRATNGSIHFKISPVLQMLFAEVMHETESGKFREWWDAVKTYVEDKALAGSDFAANCLKEIDSAVEPSPNDRLFHYYHFAPVGLRDGSGQFKHRELFYTLSEDFHVEYRRRAEILLGEVAEDVLGQ